MTGLEELKAAYEHMSNDFGFLITNVLFNNINERWEFIFDWFGVGLRMRLGYEFIMRTDPYTDDIIFRGDPCLHFSVACYRAITDFIETLQKYRSDKNTMMAFIDYLKEQCDEYSD